MAMPVPFSAVVTPQTITFVSPDGRTQTATSSHSNFEAMLVLLREIGAARKAMQPIDALVAKLMELAEPARVIREAVERINASGIVEVRDGVVYHRGEPQRGVLADRILWTVEQGHDAGALTAFLEHLMENPSKRAVDRLWTFVEKHRMGLTPDGYILAYKKVRHDFFDIHTGTIDNSPGTLVEMPRNQVSDDPNDTCSAGLHACALHYLNSYGSHNRATDRVVIVKINPANVVSVPFDSGASKLRCCHYDVLSEYLGSTEDDILGSKPVFDEREFRHPEDFIFREVDDDDFDEEDDDDDDFDDDDDDAGEAVQAEAEVTATPTADASDAAPDSYPAAPVVDVPMSGIDPATLAQLRQPLSIDPATGRIKLSKG